MATRTHLWYDPHDDEYFASHAGFARDDGGTWRDVTRDPAQARRAAFFGEWIGSVPCPRELRLKGTEHGEQAALFCWFAAMVNLYPEWAYPLKWAFAVPNGGARDRVTASMMKAEGVRSGVPDLMIPATNPTYAGLFIEMKKVKDGTLSKEQAAYLEWLQSQRYYAARANGFYEARNVVLQYFKVDAPPKLH